MDDSRDAFYLGYAPAMPPGLRRFLRPRIGAILAGALGVALVLAWSQRPPAEAEYEYGRVRRWTGTLIERPWPMLMSADSGPVRTWLLAGQGKRGAAALVAGYHGRRVTLDAVRLARGSTGMLEAHGPPAPSDRGVAPPAARELGRTTVTGEIVDSKCWTGAMNPGQGATHRLCAVRCLLGDLPPLLVGVDQDGREVVAVLAGPGGTPPGPAVLRYVAARVRATGQLRRLGSLLVLEADTASLHRVP